MKKKIIVGITATVAIASVLSITSAMANEKGDEVPGASLNKVDTSITDSSVITGQDIAVLHSAGVKLKKPTSNAALTEEDAIAAASKYAPGYAEEAKKVTAEFQLLTNGNLGSFSEQAKEKNPKLKQDGFLNDTPVYIVTFKGVTKLGHDGNPNTKKAATVFTEYNVVVDANSGEILYGFSYR